MSMTLSFSRLNGCRRRHHRKQQMSSGHIHYYELVDLIHLYDTTKIILPFCITNQVFSVHYTSIIHYLEANSPILQILLFMLLSRSETFKNIQQTILRSEIRPGTAAGQATRSHERNQATRSRPAVGAGGHARAQQAQPATRGRPRAGAAGAAGHARAATRGRSRPQPATRGRPRARSRRPRAAGGGRRLRCCGPRAANPVLRACGRKRREEKKNSPDFFGKEECGAVTRKKRAVRSAQDPVSPTPGCAVRQESAVRRARVRRPPPPRSEPETGAADCQDSTSAPPSVEPCAAVRRGAPRRRGPSPAPPRSEPRAAVRRGAPRRRGPSLAPPFAKTGAAEARAPPLPSLLHCTGPRRTQLTPGHSTPHVARARPLHAAEDLAVLSSSCSHLSRRTGPHRARSTPCPASLRVALCHSEALHARSDLSAPDLRCARPSVHQLGSDSRRLNYPV
ncbi:hypothetical protein GUJ93_ZPchr0010g8947 [Zizania palustris]|uniref:Uncharacterized protein n=1 Tax=Zizania palustris TaxID=103762 RepID=A0A8J5WB80_ZIZPA|nr:hypothetical protein GUJ93_ZPchr0010g8947 [Zizania palustris]